MEQPASVTLVALIQMLFAGLTLLVSLLGVMIGAVVGDWLPLVEILFSG